MNFHFLMKTRETLIKDLFQCVCQIYIDLDNEIERVCFRTKF